MVHGAEFQAQLQGMTPEELEHAKNKWERKERRSKTFRNIHYFMIIPSGGSAVLGVMLSTARVNRAQDKLRIIDGEEHRRRSSSPMPPQMMPAGDFHAQFPNAQFVHGNPDHSRDFDGMVDADGNLQGPYAVRSLSGVDLSQCEAVYAVPYSQSRNASGVDLSETSTANTLLNVPSAESGTAGSPYMSARNGSNTNLTPYPTPEVRVVPASA